MKKTISMFLVAAFFSLFTIANAQKDTSLGGKIKGGAKSMGKDIGKGGKAVGKGAKAVGNNTAELASKGKSKVVDKTYDGKTGPDGQTVYINDKSKYYWVDKTGHKHFITKAQLKDKVD